MRVDPRPAFTINDISTNMAAHYQSWGFQERKPQNPDFTLGEWEFDGRVSGEFIGHGTNDGALWIWICPAVGVNSAVKTADRIKQIIADQAPKAEIQIQKHSFFDLR